MGDGSFLLYGNGPSYNRGCEAILRGTISIIERSFGPAHFVVANFAKHEGEDFKRDVSRVPLEFEVKRFSKKWFFFFF